MPSQIISTDITTTVTVDGYSTVILLDGASVATADPYGFRFVPTAVGADLVINGDVTVLAGDAISASGTLVDAYNSITVGPTGSVTSGGGTGIYCFGNQSDVVNHGTVLGGYAGVYMQANPSTASGFTFSNFGTVSADVAVTLVGEGGEGLNAGLITGSDVGILLGLTAGSFVNSGQVTSLGDYGVQLSDGNSPDFLNTGRIESLGTGVLSVSLLATITNAGQITAGGDGIRVTGGSLFSEALGQALILSHTGTIDAEEEGIEFWSDDGVLRATGGITSGRTGIVATGNRLELATGTIDAGSDGLRLTGDDALITLGGRIDAGARGVHVTGDAPVIWSDADIIAQGDAGLRIDGLNDASVETWGRVVSLAGVGITIDSDDARVVNGGEVSGAYYGMVLTFSGDPLAVSRWKVTNSGDIEGGFGGISSDVGFLNLLNTGTIRALEGTALEVADPAKVVNQGLIAAGADGDAILFGAGEDVLRNSGDILGDVDAGASGDSLRNGGTIEGNVKLGDGDDRLLGMGGVLGGSVDGGRGKDTLVGGASDDTLLGGSANDVIEGRGGGDVIDGGAGRDTLSGGGDADRFVFRSAAEAGAVFNGDQILDFRPGEDIIDLSAILPGGSFIGSAAFQAGFGNVLRHDAAAGRLLGELDGDTVADFAILLLNRPAALSAGDFDFIP